MIGLDLGNVLVNLWKCWKQDQELQDWIKLLLGASFSAFIAFTGVSGGALVAGRPFLISLGSGLLACAVSTMAVLLRDPRARSLMLSIPQAVTVAYQETQGQTTIQPGDPGKK